jgi:hypothetical protein
MPSVPSDSTSPVCGLNTSTPKTFTRIMPVAGSSIFDVGLAEDDEQVAAARGLQVAAHVQVGVHAGLQHRHAAELVELGRGRRS